MTSRSRYAKPQQDASQDTPARDPMKCAAYGCPLAGTNTSSLKGSEQWYCRFHDGHEVAEFDNISARINRHRALIEHESKVRRMGPIAGERVTTGNALHRRQPGESYADYLRRLSGLVFDAIHGGGPANRNEDAA